MSNVRSILAAAAITGFAFASAGCNIVGPAYYLIHGPEKVKKVHTLDETKTAVVFVDDRQNRVPRRALRQTIGEECEKTLLKQEVVKDMVASQSAMLAAGNDRYGKPASVSEIGEAVKADVVIYATVDTFTLSPDGETFAPTAALRVKVIDVAMDTRVWPPDEDGYPLVVRPLARASELPTSLSERYRIEDELARETGLALSHLFFNHERQGGPRTPD